MQIATMKMIVLLLVTTLLLKYSLGNVESGNVEKLLLKYSLGNTESESVETVIDVAKQGILINYVFC